MKCTLYGETLHDTVHQPVISSWKHTVSRLGEQWRHDGIMQVEKVEGGVCA